jgi:uncharacterized coiled-coil protein SlyX
MGDLERVDGDDYTWEQMMQPLDVRTADQKVTAAIANLNTAVAALADEVSHLREDIARMKAGDSQL